MDLYGIEKRNCVRYSINIYRDKKFIVIVISILFYSALHFLSYNFLYHFILYLLVCCIVFLSVTLFGFIVCLVDFLSVVL